MWNDFHATVLKLLGFDNERFTYKYQGLEQKLTGVEPARVVTAVVHRPPQAGPGRRPFPTRDVNQGLALSVEDDGIGHTSGGAPKSTGLGQRIVKAMATKLDAQLTQDSAHVGSRIVVSFRPREAPAARL